MARVQYSFAAIPSQTSFFLFLFLMNKSYKMLLALGVATASLSSCSRADYVVNATTPHSEPVQIAAPVPASDAAASGTASVKATAPKAALTKVAPEATAVVTPRRAAEVTRPTQVVKEAATVSPELAATNAAPSAKPSLMQRLALKSVIKQINKIQQKQATANTEKTASKKGNAALIALAGLLLAVLGLIIVGGSGLGGSGAGVAIGAILFYVGFIAFIVGLVLLVVHLVNGD